MSIALAEYQKTLSHTNDPDREVLACPKELSIGQFHFKFKREKTITVLEYIHSRWKIEMQNIENTQYLCYCLDGLEREKVNSTKQFIIPKSF